MFEEYDVEFSLHMFVILAHKVDHNKFSLVHNLTLTIKLILKG